jgi:hypothetical protein
MALSAVNESVGVLKPTSPVTTWMAGTSPAVTWFSFSLA